MSKLMLAVLIIFVSMKADSSIATPPDNLLLNPTADLYAQSWQPNGVATVEEHNGDRCFVVRSGGYFFQDVALPEKTEGQYLVLVGRGASERVNPDGAITGLPYLYGYMMSQDKGGGILVYLQGQKMLGSSTQANTWMKMWGIFKIPTGTGKVRFFLKQALRQGVPHNGSAASFDDLGLYVFPTEDEAKAFVSQPD
jgi:hypothetical protein